MSKSFRKLFSLGLVVILLLSFMNPALALDRKSSQKVDLQSNAAEVYTDKISQELVKQFEKDDQVTYLIKLKEQADTSSASQNALKMSKAKNETPSVTKLTMRNAVVSELRETAGRSQAGLVQYLEKMQAKGEVKDFESFFIVNSMAITSSKEIMEKIAAREDVAKILPNVERFLDKGEPSTEQRFQIQGDNQTNNIEWNIARVGAPEVWAMGIDGSGTVVANLDTGVDLTHPAVQSSWRGFNSEGDVTNPELSWYDAHSDTANLPVDTDGHGTHTMGTMVGAEPDGTNQIGVAPGAKWIAVRVFNPSTTDQILLRGGQWIIAPRDNEGNLHPELAPDVVNNSWGGGPGLDEWYRPMVQAWRDAQIFPEFSAGNTRAGNPGGPGSVANPANYPESFATGATDINDGLASFSLQGPSPYGELKPEVSAPGVNVRSSVPGGSYANYNGTSMAGPHTTAVAALLLSVNSSLTVDELEEIIINTATPLTNDQYPESPNNGFGHGLVNAYDAVGSIMNGLGHISGRVSTEGNDFEAPTLEHEPVTFAYSGSDIPFEAHVSDKVGVVTVEAFARANGSSHWTYIPMDRTSGDYKDGIYEGAIPYFLLSTAGVEYYLRVNDYGNNGFKTEPYTIEISNGVTPGYFQDFEENAIGFVTGGNNNTWEWGEPTSGPGQAYSGNKLMATNLDGQYSNGSNTYMLMPPIDLLDHQEGAFLTFKHWYEFENSYDRGTVYIAAASTDYEFIPILEFTGPGHDWHTEFIDLSVYAGEQVHVLFNVTSDGSVARDGWYIDNIALSAPDEVSPSSPQNVTIEQDVLGKVTLNWDAGNEEDLKEYVVYRSIESGTNYQMLGSTTNNTISDANTEHDSTYYYVIKAVDWSGNESEASTEISITIVAPETLFSDDFEGVDDNGWTHEGTNDEWERGEPLAGPSSAVSGMNVWGTDLDDKYENNSAYYLMSPPIDLTAAQNATLTFQHWYEIEGGSSQWDKGFLEISADGGQTWNELALFSHSTNGRVWSNVSIGISEYTGSEVNLRFRLTSDGSVPKLGWYIDDLRILNIAGPETAIPPGEQPEGEVKPKPIHNGPAFELHRTEQSHISIEHQLDGSPVIQALPASASVTVLESGRSVNTDPSTGLYKMMHVAGDYTLRAEAYGYYAQDVQVTVEDSATAVANFELQAIPYGTVTGIITDERTGEPIAGAQVMVMEDARISPVTSDVYGSYTLDVLEGDYTLAVSAADYYNKTLSIYVGGGETVNTDVALKPFVGYEGEISYDDGTAENARAFYDAGNGWAMRMTPDQGSAQVTGALFRFWDTEWPVPGGTTFQYAVYDASGPNGAPGRKLEGPFDGVAKRDGGWTEVNFGDAGIMVDGDFYIVYIQAAPNPNAPGLATDEDGTNALRSWQLVGGIWSQSPVDEGNYMIRALLKYAVGAPDITSPATDSYTNQEIITVTGTSNAEGASINLYNGEEIVSNGTVENGVFSIETTLHEGHNGLSVEAEVNGKFTDRSEEISVTLDRELPTLEVSSPADSETVNSEVLYVTGTTSDTHFDSLWVNGNEANVSSNGTFSYRMLVNEGENVITVKSLDLAGNETIVTRTIHVDLDPAEISNIQPSSDLHINAGETVDVSFDSEEGLQAGFRVELPLLFSTENRNEIMMTETTPGHYEGSWTTPDDLNVDGAIIVVRVWDNAGNETETAAAGKLYITSSGEEEPILQEPIAVIQAVDAAKKKKPTSFDGSQSHDADGSIVSYEWDFGDGTTSSDALVSHSFSKSGTYTVTLTVTDNDGLTGTITHTITVK
jgi:bacillopeptidase F (M6 metalloprotease family)